MAQDRIGLFGGTFNPIHAGHLHAATRARETFGLGEVLLVPSFFPPHKESRDLAPAADRLEMVRLAVRGRPGLAACPVEVEAGVTSYAVATVDKMRDRYPAARLFYIVGTDAFAEIETWKDHRRLLEECQWIVLTRPGWPDAGPESVLGGRWAGRTRRLADGEAPDEDLFLNARIIIWDAAALAISSSQVRETVRSGRSLAGLVPAAVEAYIRSRHLYQ
jgi:nicotinate-nucleotide adenylyltransferase